MANEPEGPKVGDLFKAKEISEAHIAAAVTSYLERESLGPIVPGERYTVDVAEAVARLRRTIIRAAVILARPLIA